MTNRSNVPRVTVITSTNPPTLSKHYTLDDSGGLQKTTAGNISEGRYEIEGVPGLHEMKTLLQSLKPNQALVFGTPQHDAGDLTTVASLKGQTDPTTIARSREHLTYGEGPGWLWLDLDRMPPGYPECASWKNVIVPLATAVPGLLDTGGVVYYSSSSFIYMTGADEPLQGVRGLHIWIPVEDCSLIPEALISIQEQLWQADLGWVEISAAGTLLDRTLVDASSAQPERLAFAAGAVCGAGLEQRRGEPVIIDPSPDSTGPLDLRKIIRKAPAADKKRQAARKAMEQEAKVVRDAYVRKRAVEELQRSGISAPDASSFDAVVKRLMTAKGGELALDFMLDIRGEGFVSVGDIIANRDKYHGAICRDPEEPEYRDGAWVGIVYTDGTPCVHSQAHGGRTFKLTQPPPVQQPIPAITQPIDPLMITAVKGGAIPVASADVPHLYCAETVMSRLAGTGNYFNRGGSLHEIADERLTPLDACGLITRIESLGQTLQLKKNRAGTFVLEPSRPNEQGCKAIIRCSSAISTLPPINIVAHAPVLFKTDNGTVTATGGYCREAECYVIGDHDMPNVSEREAADLLEDLFTDFDFKTPNDKARAIAFLLTTGLRLGGFIDDRRCPMFVIEANDSQAGKGTMVDMVATIYKEAPSVVTERDGGVGSFDESLQNALIAGRPFVLLDNLKRKLGGGWLESMLTAIAPVACRVPHCPEVAVDVSRMIIVATSNGMQSSLDMANRSVITRIKKQPRYYRFRKWGDLDLLAYCRKEQPRLLSAVHAVIRGWHDSGSAMADVTGHSFRDWHRMAQAILQRSWPHLPELIDDQHIDTAQRMADPWGAWLRTVMLHAEFGKEYCATALVELGESAGVEPPSFSDKVRAIEEKARDVGRHMGNRFQKNDHIEFDGMLIYRRCAYHDRADGKGSRAHNVYKFAAPLNPPNPPNT